MKFKINALVNVLAFIALLFSAVSGFVLWFALPRGSGNTGEIFLEIARHSWTSIHNYSSLIFVLFVAVHLVLHFNWIKNIGKMLK